jgi:hypothetical protein
LNLGELLDRTFSYYRRHFVLFVGIAALPSLFGLILHLWQLDAARRGTGGTAGVVLWGLAALVVFLVASTFSQGATVVAVSQIQLDRDANIREAFASIWQQLGELLVLALNIGVRVGVGFLLFIIPGIFVWLKYSIAVPAAILEQNGVSASLQRSSDLTKGRRGRIFVICVLYAILILVASMVWEVPAMFIGGRALGAAARLGQVPVAAQVVVQFGSFVTQSIVSPIVTIALTLVYYDERVRREAFDLEHMMRQIDGASPEPLPAA